MHLQAAETVDLKRSHHKVDLAIIMLREVSQTEKGEDPMLSHTWDTDLKATDRTDRDAETWAVDQGLPEGRGMGK